MPTLSAFLSVRLASSNFTVTVTDNGTQSESITLISAFIHPPPSGSSGKFHRDTVGKGRKEGGIFFILLAFVHLTVKLSPITEVTKEKDPFTNTLPSFNYVPLLVIFWRRRRMGRSVIQWDFNEELADVAI